MLAVSENVWHLFRCKLWGHWTWTISPSLYGLLSVFSLKSFRRVAEKYPLFFSWMKKPRCGVPDQTRGSSKFNIRRKRYALTGQKWQHKHITYRYKHPSLPPTLFHFYCFVILFDTCYFMIMDYVWVINDVVLSFEKVFIVYKLSK